MSHLVRIVRADGMHFTLRGFRTLTFLCVVGCSPQYFEVVISSDDDAEAEREQHSSCTPESCIVCLEVTGATTSLRSIAGLFSLSTLAVRDAPELQSLQGLEGSFRDDVGVRVIDFSGDNRSLADITPAGDVVELREILEITGTHALELAAFPRLTEVNALVLDDASACIFAAPNLEQVSSCRVSSEDESCRAEACR